MDLTKDDFFIVAKAFFIAFPQIKAITISNMLNNDFNGHYFTLWKDLNFQKIVSNIRNNRWQYINNGQIENSIGSIKFNSFELLLKTKGLYVLTREDLGIRSIPYKIENQLTFLLKFGLFFHAFDNLKEIHYKMGNKLVLRSNNDVMQLEFENGFVVRKNNQNFIITKNEWITIGSLILAYKNKIGDNISLAPKENISRMYEVPIQDVNDDYDDDDLLDIDDLLEEL